MSSLIEQAVKRLEELRRAGVAIPPADGLAPGPAEAVVRLDDPFEANPGALRPHLSPGSTVPARAPAAEQRAPAARVGIDLIP